MADTKESTICEGCKKVSPSVKGVTHYQCVWRKPHQFCDDCKNRQNCPLHPWAKMR